MLGFKLCASHKKIHCVITEINKQNDQKDTYSSLRIIMLSNLLQETS